MSGPVLVDTNVVSELMFPYGDRAVMAWLDRMHRSDLFLASTSLAELRFGIAVLPEGRRKSKLGGALDHVLAALFVGRTLPFDEGAAERFAEITSRAQKRGRRIEIADGQIAAVAAVHGMTVATRDVGPFEAAGVKVVNPWVGAESGTDDV